MSKIDRLNNKRLLRVESFFNEKRDLYNKFEMFNDFFFDYKAHTKKNNVWILDELTDGQKELFFKYYNFAIQSGGDFYSKKYCNDNEYRTQFIFPREDESMNIILIKK